jgi:hypothetical protein
MESLCIDGGGGDNIKTEIKETKQKDVEWAHLAQNMRPNFSTRRVKY